jgi:hypothetical protein
VKVLATHPLDLTTAANLAAMGFTVSTVEPGQDVASAVASGKPDVVVLGPDYAGSSEDLRGAGLVVFSDASPEVEAWRGAGLDAVTATPVGPAETADMIFRMAEDAARTDEHYQKRMQEMGAGHVLSGLVLGLIGFGEVGKHMRDRAEELNMPIVVYSTHLSDEGADVHRVRRMPDVKTLAAQADIVSVHESLRADTVGLLDGLFFAAMKPSAILINTSSSLMFGRDALLAYLARDPRWVAPGEIVDAPDFPSLGVLQAVHKYRSERIGL